MNIYLITLYRPSTKTRLSLHIEASTLNDAHYCAGEMYPDFLVVDSAFCDCPRFLYEEEYMGVKIWLFEDFEEDNAKRTYVLLYPGKTQVVSPNLSPYAMFGDIKRLIDGLDLISYI